MSRGLARKGASEMQVWLNGEMIERDRATVSVLDRGFLYGDGLFETVRAYAGTPFQPAEHLARLQASGSVLGIPVPDGLDKVIAQLIRANGLGDAYVRVTVSRGPHTGALAPDDPPTPTVLVEARPLHPYPVTLYERGAVAVVSSLPHDGSNPLRRHKTTSYLLSILARREAKQRGADEALLLDPAGNVAEGATSNVFCVRGGELFTPPLDLNILPGVTRATVIDLARRAGIPVREERFRLASLLYANEVFLTNSLMELLPLHFVEDHAFSPIPGPVTQVLAEAYRALVAGR
jgi:branched-chain amino acid aminotransferase group I